METWLDRIGSPAEVANCPGVRWRLNSVADRRMPTPCPCTQGDRPPARTSASSKISLSRKSLEVSSERGEIGKLKRLTSNGPVLVSQTDGCKHRTVIRCLVAEGPDCQGTQDTGSPCGGHPLGENYDALFGEMLTSSEILVEKQDRKSWLKVREGRSRAGAFRLYLRRTVAPALPNYNHNCEMLALTRRMCRARAMGVLTLDRTPSLFWMLTSEDCVREFALRHATPKIQFRKGFDPRWDRSINK